MKKNLFFGILAILAVLLFFGCGDDDPKDKDPTPPFEGKVLKVTGLPSNINILGAALFTQSGMDPQDPKPTAIGINSPNGTFNLYHVASGSLLPDTKKPWKGTGEYIIALSTKMDNTGDQYVYTGGEDFVKLDSQAFIIALMKALAEETEEPDDDKIQEIITEILLDDDIVTYKKYNFQQSTTTLKYDQFIKVDEDEIEQLIAEKAEEALSKLEDAFILEVEGIDEDTTIIAAYLFDTSEDTPTPVAIGIYYDGSFAFFNFAQDGKTPDFSKPFSEDGSYGVSIITLESQTLTTYNYWDDDEEEFISVDFPTEDSLKFDEFTKAED